MLLVDGRMVLTPDGRDLIRVEGRLAKNPSFWTSLVNVVRRYATLGGVRVPVSTETTAKIKFVGNSQLEVAYEYETVNGRPGQPDGAASVDSRSLQSSRIFSERPLDILQEPIYLLVDTRQEDGWRRNLTCCRARWTC